MYVICTICSFSETGIIFVVKVYFHFFRPLTLWIRTSDVENIVILQSTSPALHYFTTVIILAWFGNISMMSVTM